MIVLRAKGSTVHPNATASANATLCETVERKTRGGTVDYRVANDGRRT
jgi:hypothetical protein